MRVRIETENETNTGGPEVCWAVGPCSLGFVALAASAEGVCTILLGDNPDALASELRERFPRAQPAGARDGAALLAKAVAVVEAPAQGFDGPLDPRGTVFERRVWNALREIPAGSTASYAAVAERIGAPTAARAVARACAANRLAVAIPCHRVVRSGGALGGYRWCVERKRSLLAREGAA